jgi:hypothetical protein
VLFGIDLSSSPRFQYYQTLDKMPRSAPPTEKEIWTIARRTTNIIETHLTSDVCLFGSAACALWADIGRTPNVRAGTQYPSLTTTTTEGLDFSQDIDIVVSNDHIDAEDVKDIIVEADNRYFLEPSKQRGATHRILFCRLPGWWTDGRRVKIDILVPPTLKLPEIQDSERIHFKRIPVMPIFDLLVMKTRGWFDHRTSDREDYRAKEDADVNDIIALLERAVEDGISYDNEAYETRHSQNFMVLAALLVKRFVRAHGRRHLWQALDFPV